MTAYFEAPMLVPAEGRPCHAKAHLRARRAAHSGELAGKLANTLLGVAIGLGRTHTRPQIRCIAQRVSRLLPFFDSLWQEPTRAFVCGFRGWEHLERALARGQGAILTTAHFSAYRWLTLELLARGRRITMLVDDTFKRELDRDVYTRLSTHYPEHGSDRFRTCNSQDTTALWQLARSLKQGRIVLSFIDGNSGTEGKAAKNGSLELPWLGQTIRVRPGLAALATASGSPVLPVLATHDSAPSATFDIFPPIESFEPNESRLETRLRIMTTLFDVLEREIAKRPEAWEEWWLLPHWLAGSVRLPCERIVQPKFILTLPGIVGARLRLPDNSVWPVRSGPRTALIDLGSATIRDVDPIVVELIEAAERGVWAREWIEGRPEARACLEREIRSGRVVLDRSLRFHPPLSSVGATRSVSDPRGSEHTSGRGAHVEVDGTRCIGCAAGVSIAPELFELGPRGTIVRRQPTSDVEIGRAETAAWLCPARAITVKRSAP